MTAIYALRRLGITTVAIALAGASASAGTFFRLEIGPPVAGGTNYKLKGAVLAVRALVCEDLASVHVTGTAEGMVNGARQSVPLRIIPAGSPGIFMVQGEWPADGWGCPQATIKRLSGRRGSAGAEAGFP